MRLWTLQPSEIYEIIKKEGFFRCNPERSDWFNYDEDFAFAYRYMAQKLAEKTGEPAVLPVWAWYKVHGKRTMPEPEWIGADTLKGDYVLMELEIPDEKVLLSNFDKWNSVIMHHYVYAAAADEEADREDAYLSSLSAEELEQCTVKSFDRVFDLTYTGFFSDDTQACFAEIKKENIKGIKLI